MFQLLSNEMLLQVIQKMDPQSFVKFYRSNKTAQVFCDDNVRSIKLTIKTEGEKDSERFQIRISQNHFQFFFCMKRSAKKCCNLYDSLEDLLKDLVDMRVIFFIPLNLFFPAANMTQEIDTLLEFTKRYRMRYNTITSDYCSLKLDELIAATKPRTVVTRKVNFIPRNIANLEKFCCDSMSPSLVISYLENFDGKVKKSDLRLDLELMRSDCARAMTTFVNFLQALPSSSKSAKVSMTFPGENNIIPRLGSSFIKKSIADLKFAFAPALNSKYLLVTQYVKENSSIDCWNDVTQFRVAFIDTWEEFKKIISKKFEKKDSDCKIPYKQVIEPYRRYFE